MTVRSTNALVAAIGLRSKLRHQLRISGDSRASVAARSTVRFSEASSSTLVDRGRAALGRAVTVIVTDVLVTPPEVVMLASANRVLPLHSLEMFTRASSTAVASASTRSASAFACVVGEQNRTAP